MALSPEEIEAEVSQLLRMVDMDALIGFCDEFRVNIPTAKEGNKNLVVRLLLNHLNSDTVSESEDHGQAMFLKLHSDLKLLEEKGEDKEVPGTRVDVDTKISLEDTKKDISQKLLNNTFEKKKMEIRQTQIISNDGTPVVQIQRFRDFKISGVIGSQDHKDTLSFASLSSQIQQGKEAGYSYKEIRAAVIKAIKPGQSLRNYLESNTNLSESAFLKILRSHYKVKDSTLLFHDLSNAVQLNSESEMDFCLRVMHIRDMILSSSVQEGCPFDPILIQKRFFRTLSTGFKHSSIRLELQNILQSGTISDDNLIHEIGLIECADQERASKLNKVKVAVSEVSSIKSDLNENLNKRSRKPKENVMLTELNKLTVKINELSSVRTEIQELKNQIQNQHVQNCNQISLDQDNFDSQRQSNYNSFQQPPFNPRYRQSDFNHPRQPDVRRQSRLFRCQDCHRKNVSFCNHCFSCGATDHRKFKCPKLQKNE